MKWKTILAVVSLAAGLVACDLSGTKLISTAASAAIDSQIIPKYQEMQNKVIDSGLRFTAVAFQTEVLSDCLEKGGPIDSNQAIQTVTSYDRGHVIKMKGKLSYNKTSSLCSGAFTVTDSKSGHSRDFNIPLTEADKKAPTKVSGL